MAGHRVDDCSSRVRVHGAIRCHGSGAVAAKLGPGDRSRQGWQAGSHAAGTHVMLQPLVLSSLQCKLVLHLLLKVNDFPAHARIHGVLLLPNKALQSILRRQAGTAFRHGRQPRRRGQGVSTGRQGSTSSTRARARHANTRRNHQRWNHAEGEAHDRLCAAKCAKCVAPAPRSPPSPGRRGEPIAGVATHTAS